jgi:L-glutamine-phosphate cytidylyltransferase
LRCIILAAGRGSRLHDKTYDRPKCLVELAGQSLLGWQLKAMRKAGIKEIMVVRGYRGEMITGNFIAIDNANWQNTNMVASLVCAKEWLEYSTCIVSYSDIVYNSSAVEKLMKSSSPLALLYDQNWLELWQKRFDNPLDDAESFAVNENDTITDIGRKGVALAEIHGQYMGLLKFTPESFKWTGGLLAERKSLVKELDMTGLLSRLIDKGYPIEGVPWNGSWCEIDNVKDLEVAEVMAKKGILLKD